MAGANPTFAAIWVQLGLVVKMLNDIELKGSSSTPNLYDQEDAYVTGSDGEYTPAAVAAFREMRGVMSSQLTPTKLKRVFRPFWDEMARVIGTDAQGSSELELIANLIKYMNGTSDTLNSRSLTLPGVGAITGTGTGVIPRLTVDRYGEILECVGAEDMIADVVQDQNMGVEEQAEVWRFRGHPPARDFLAWEGSGINRRVATVNGQTASAYLQNPSWDTHDAGTSDDASPATLTGITGWTITTAVANLKMRNSAALTYRTYPGQPTTDGAGNGWSVEFDADDTLTQVIQAQPGKTFPEGTPFHCQIAWQRLASATGNITLTLGSKTATVALATGTNGLWNVLQIASGVNNWVPNWGGQDSSLKVAVDTLAVGTCVIDDFILAPMSLVDGTYYIPMGGATPYLFEDLFDWTNAQGVTRGTIMYWLWQAYRQPQSGLWFPSNDAGAETISDP